MRRRFKVKRERDGLLKESYALEAQLKAAGSQNENGGEVKAQLSEVYFQLGNAHYQLADDWFERDHYISACHYYRKASQLTEHEAAQYNLGMLCQEGRSDYDDYRLDDDRAVYYYHLAANQGHVKAKHALDDDRAVCYYHLAANQGHVKAEHAFAWMYQEGRAGVVSENVTRAAHYYRVAAMGGVCEGAKQNRLDV
jgi:TPR repeat protein